MLGADKDVDARVLAVRASSVRRRIGIGSTSKICCYKKHRTLRGISYCCQHVVDYKSSRGEPVPKGSQAWIRALGAISGLAEDARTLPQRLPELAERFGPRPALLGEAGSLTYAVLAARSNQYGRWAQQQGLGHGEVVCLLMPNCAEYPAIWLGISGVGGVAALLNTALRHDALVYAITIVAPRHVIADAALADTLDEVRPRLPPGTRCWVYGAERAGWPRLDVTGLPDGAVALERSPTLADRALHIYTSGTTGLPKAVNIGHARVLEWCLWFAGMMDIGPEDRMYDCLPMYHSIGGVVAVGAMLAHGGSVLIRPGFSASRFWDDVVDGGCTVFQYIGELCRYLVNSPPHPREHVHALRLACGNGMQAEVWTRFTERFQIPHVLEYYAATEGSVSLYNVEERPGAIGRIPPYLAHRFPVALIRCDPQTGLALRDTAGRCQRCRPGEIGEAIGPVPAQGLYTDPGASEAKILRDVFAAGDAWFRTGDLMRRDQNGFFTFVDRIGDTFRWKGENVATAEVADALGTYSGIASLVVYGVSVPGMEGRAGMAALAVDAAFRMDELHAHLAARLPEHAWPLFLRLCPALETTGTFKPVKADLAREGFDPSQVTDASFVMDRAGGRYVPLDAALFGRILTGELRL